MENGLTIVGNLTADPEIRFTQSGTAVANFTVAHTPRVKENGEWKDGESTFIKCTIWRQYAENVAESLRRGMQVIVTGALRQRSWTAKDGTERHNIELDVDAIGPTLKFATAKVERNVRDGGANRSGSPTGSDSWRGGSDDSAPF